MLCCDDVVLLKCVKCVVEWDEVNLVKNFVEWSVMMKIEEIEMLWYSLLRELFYDLCVEDEGEVVWWEWVYEEVMW